LEKLKEIHIQEIGDYIFEVINFGLHNNLKLTTPECNYFYSDHYCENIKHLII
jgi:hypothetical protein